MAVTDFEKVIPPSWPGALPVGNSKNSVGRHEESEGEIMHTESPFIFITRDSSVERRGLPAVLRVANSPGLLLDA